MILLTFSINLRLQLNWIERLATDQEVLGSNPSRRTNFLLISIKYIIKQFHGINKKYWNELITNEKKPLNNKAIAGLYPPGSTIKIIVALSALENGIGNPKKYLNCTGVTELYGEKFHCWKKKGHGPMNLRSAIQRLSLIHI